MARACTCYYDSQCLWRSPAVDGIANKIVDDSWFAAPPEEKAITFRVAEGIRFIEYGTNSIFRILQGTVAVIFGIAILKNKIISRWIGGTGVVIGAVTIYAGLEVASRVLPKPKIDGLIQKPATTMQILNAISKVIMN